MTIFVLISETAASAELFFGSGVLLLIAGLAFFAVWLRFGSRSASPPRAAVTVQMGIKNSGRHPGRSMLCAALVGCACFVIVAVGANRHVEREQGAVPQKESGTGGFPLVAESDIPLHHDLNSQDGRFELGFSESDSETTAKAQIFPFRLLPGEDASCLNLYRPQKPRILGASKDFIERGGFQFQGTTAAMENPWELLEAELEPGVIPAIGDYNSVQWILHLGLGDELSIQNEVGRAVKTSFGRSFTAQYLSERDADLRSQFQETFSKPKWICIFLNSDAFNFQPGDIHRKHRPHWACAGKRVGRLRFGCYINDRKIS